MVRKEITASPGAGELRVQEMDTVDQLVSTMSGVRLFTEARRSGRAGLAYHGNI